MNPSFAPANSPASVTDSSLKISLGSAPSSGFEADKEPPTVTTEAPHASLLLGITSFLMVSPTDAESLALDAAEMAAVKRDYENLSLTLSSSGKKPRTIERLGREAKCTIFLTNRETPSKDVQSVTEAVAALRAIGIPARTYSVPSAHPDTSAWLLAAGAERVKLALETAAKRTLGKAEETLEGGYIPLGYLGGKYIAWSNDFAQVQKIAVSSSTSLAVLMHLANEEWLIKKYPKIERGQLVGFDSVKAGSALRNECARLRGFDSGRVRLTGVWKDGDEWICNATSAWRAADGTPVPRIGEYIYASGADLKVTHDTPQATVADAEECLDFLHTFAWDRTKHRDAHGRYSAKPVAGNTDTDPLIVLGVLQNMFLCAGLDRRPHLFVHADTDSGKSVLTKFASLILGKAAHKSGGSSGAGLAQKSHREESHLGLIIEESGHNSSYIESKADYLKLGYDGTKKDLGTTDQAGLEMEIRSLCFMAGVAVPKMDKEVMNRINLLKMSHWAGDDRPTHRFFTDGEATPNKEVSDLGLRLFSRALKSAPRFDRAIAMLKAAVGFKNRAANTLIPCMAGSFVFLRDEEMTLAIAQEWAARFDLTADLERTKEFSVGKDIVRHLQTAEVSTTTGGMMSLGELIQRAAFDTPKGQWRADLGRKYGLRIDRNTNGTPLLGLSPTATGFKKLMSTTEYHKADLKELILRIDGVSRISTKGSIGGDSEYFHTIPWNLPTDDAGNEIEPTPLA